MIAIDPMLANVKCLTIRGTIMPVCRIACLAPIALLFCGCGTLVNLEGMPTLMSGATQDPARVAYGGMLIDLYAAPHLFSWDSSTDNEKSEPFLSQVGRSINQFDEHLIFAALLAIDFPLSLVGDTLTLPITIPKTWERLRSQSSGETTTSPDGGK